MYLENVDTVVWIQTSFLGDIVLSTGAFASKARMDALQQDAAYGSRFMQDSRNVFRNPRRSILTLLAILIGIWTSVSLSGLARGARNQTMVDLSAALSEGVGILEP